MELLGSNTRVPATEKTKLETSKKPYPVPDVGLGMGLRHKTFTLRYRQPGLFPGPSRGDPILMPLAYMCAKHNTADMGDKFPSVTLLEGR